LIAVNNPLYAELDNKLFYLRSVIEIINFLFQSYTQGFFRYNGIRVIRPGILTKEKK